MRIGINGKDKILTLDGEAYRFEHIDMHKEKPVWKVTLVNGEVLIVDFSKGE